MSCQNKKCNKHNNIDYLPLKNIVKIINESFLKSYDAILTSKQEYIDKMYTYNDENKTYTPKTIKFNIDDDIKEIPLTTIFPESLLEIKDINVSIKLKVCKNNKNELYAKFISENEIPNLCATININKNDN